MGLSGWQILSQVRTGLSGRADGIAGEQPVGSGQQAPHISGSASCPGGRRRTGGGWFTTVSNKDLIQFTRQLATLLDAGLPIVRSLQTLADQARAGAFRRVLREMARQINDGATLAEAMAGRPRVFRQLHVKLVEAGEKGGDLEKILFDLADYMERMRSFKRQAVVSMIYPALMLAAAIAVIVLLVWVLSSLGLPSAGFLTLLRAPAMVLIAPMAVLVILRLVGAVGPGRVALDFLKLQIPVVGKIYRKSAVARVTRTLAMMVRSGVPILEALRMTGQAAGNAAYARTLDRVEHAVQQGHNLTEAMVRSRFADAMTMNMIHVGEQSGQLDKMLFKVADTCEEDVRTMVSALISVLKPALIILMALIIGGMVIMMYARVLGSAGALMEY